MRANSKVKPHIHRYCGDWYVTGPASFPGYRVVTRPCMTIFSAFRAYKEAIGELQ